MSSEDETTELLKNLDDPEKDLSLKESLMAMRDYMLVLGRSPRGRRALGYVADDRKGRKTKGPGFVVVFSGDGPQ